MKLTPLNLILVVIMAANSIGFAQDDSQLDKPDPVPEEWTVPDCDRIGGGTKAITFTTDEGLTLASTPPLRGTIYSYGLVTLDVANTLLATTMSSEGTSILRSDDAGCKWHQITVLPVNELLLLTAAPGGKAYGWSRGRSAFYRIEGDDVTGLAAPKYIYGLAVDPENADHIRIGTYDCQLYESFDGGLSFAPLGGPVNSGSPIFYTIEFDPANSDCALCGGKGAWRTADAGVNWSAIEPFDLDDIDLVYLFEFSPGDSRRVWARSNLETMGDNIRCILTSDDGGRTFVRVLDQGAQAPDQNDTLRTLVLTNQPTMAAHPEQAGVLYVTDGSYFQNVGSNIYRYDVIDSSLSVAHINDLDGIDAIAFNPVDAGVMYLGLESESIGLAKATTASDDEKEKVRFGIAPNPFNPSTEISFALPEAAQVKLNIYNLAGQKVATVVDAYLSAGEHSVSWNGGRFASGIYLARLEAEAFAVTRKIVLLK